MPSFSHCGSMGYWIFLFLSHRPVNNSSSSWIFLFLSHRPVNNSSSSWIFHFLSHRPVNNSSSSWIWQVLYRPTDFMMGNCECVPYSIFRRGYWGWSKSVRVCVDSLGIASSWPGGLTDKHKQLKSLECVFMHSMHCRGPFLVDRTYYRRGFGQILAARCFFQQSAVLFRFLAVVFLEHLLNNSIPSPFCYNTIVDFCQVFFVLMSFLFIV